MGSRRSVVLLFLAVVAFALAFSERAFAHTYQGPDGFSLEAASGKLCIVKPLSAWDDARCEGMDKDDPRWTTAGQSGPNADLFGLGVERHSDTDLVMMVLVRVEQTNVSELTESQARKMADAYKKGALTKMPPGSSLGEGTLKMLDIRGRKVARVDWVLDGGDMETRRVFAHLRAYFVATKNHVYMITFSGGVGMEDEVEALSTRTMETLKVDAPPNLDKIFGLVAAIVPLAIVVFVLLFFGLRKKKTPPYPPGPHYGPGPYGPAFTPQGGQPWGPQPPSGNQHPGNGGGWGPPPQ